MDVGKHSNYSSIGAFESQSKCSVEKHALLKLYMNDGLFQSADLNLNEHCSHLALQ